MKKRRIRFLLGVLAVLALAYVWTLTQKNPIAEAFSLPAGYYAKEMCSCRYVLGQNTEFCLDEVKEFIAASRISVDERTKTVEGALLGFSRKAKWISPREGCRLID